MVLSKKKKKERSEARSAKIRERGGAGTKFNIGTKKVSKETFNIAKSKLGFSGGAPTKGVDTTKADEAIASRTFPEKERKAAEKAKLAETETEDPDKKKFKDTAVGDFLLGTSIEEQAAAQGGELKTGTLPITPAGPIAAGLGGAPKAARAAQTVKANLLSKFKNAFPTTADDIVKHGKDVIANTGGKSNLFGKTAIGLGTLYGVNEFLLSPSELATWAAVDNVAGQAAFLTRDVVFGVRDGTISQEEANELISGSRKSIENSKRFVNITTIANPKLWANRKQLMAAIREAERRIELSELQLIQLEGGQDNEL